MARFKNISGEDRRVGRADGRLVEAGSVTAVDGGVAEEAVDAYVVGEGDEARAWPKATWELVPEAGVKTSKKGEGE